MRKSTLLGISLLFAVFISYGIPSSYDVREEIIEISSLNYDSQSRQGIIVDNSGNVHKVPELKMRTADIGDKVKIKTTYTLNPFKIRIKTDKEVSNLSKIS